MSEFTFAAGYVFFRPGEPGEQAFLLHEGQAEIFAGTAEQPTRIALRGPGDVLGEMALIEERPRTFAARAITAGRASVVSRDEFEYMLTHDPAGTRQYLRSLFERLRSLSAQLRRQSEPEPQPQPAASPQPELAEFPFAIEIPEQTGPAELIPAKGKPSAWVVVIHPLTRKAAVTLPDDGLLITRFPLRIGRAAGPNERDGLDLNDLWLLDEKPYNISRNHCEIQIDGKGLGVCDRGSQLGCFVNDELIGGKAVTDFARLGLGENVLVIGARMSPYQFRVTVKKA